MAEYKISLGVKLNTADINSQIEKFSNNNAKKIKIEFNTKTIQSQLNSIRKQIQNLSNIKVNLNINGTGIGGGGSGNSAANNINKTANQLTTAYNKLRNISKNIGTIKIKLNGLDASTDIKQIDVLEAQLKSLTKAYHDTVSKIKSKGDLSSSQWQSIQQQIDNTKIKLEQLEAELVDTKTKLASAINTKISNGSFIKQIEEINTKFGNLGTKTVDVRSKIDALKLALSQMKNAGSIEEKINAYKRYNVILKDLENQLRINATIEGRQNNSVALAQAKQKLSLQMRNWLKENSAAAKQFGAEIDGLQAKLNRCGNMSSLQRVSAGFTNVKLRAKEAGVATQTFGNQLKAQFEKYKTYFSVATVFMYVTQGLRDMFEQVKSIDTAMTELKKVTNETDASYNQFLTNAASRAKEIGTTIDGLVTSTADFARLGYGFEDAQGLAEVANIYTVVGDEIDSVDTATQSLISTLAAFKDEMNGLSDSDFALSIVDKFNEVSNNFAISSGGIGEALTRSASSMVAANNTLDETIALITAANTVVQDPDTVGRLMPTIKVAISVKLQRWTRPSKDFI